MTPILSRYIVREHLGPFLFGFLVINFLFILNLLFRELGKLLSKGLALNVILEFLFLNLAWMIALSVPMAVLSSTLMAFGRLSADNEITAIKASGISLYQFLPPVLIVSALMACALIWFNNHVLPDFNHRARLLAMDIARKKPMINLESGVVYTEIPDYNLLVQKIKEKDSISYVENIIIDEQTNPTVIQTIIADSGEIYLNQVTGLLEITLFDGELQEVNTQRPETFKKLQFPKHMLKIPVSDMILKRSLSGYRGDREKSAAQLLEDVQLNRTRISEREKKINERIRKHLSTYIKAKSEKPKLFKTILAEHQQLRRQIQTELNMIKGYKKSSNIYLVEVHKKYSIPAASVVFVLIGAPLGIMVRQRGLAAGALSFFFFVLYWAGLIGGETLADRQIISPFLAMWSPNILVGIGGIYLVLCSIRVTTTMRWGALIKFLTKLEALFEFLTKWGKNR
ncbi:MAG: LptF/LptG family permease [bacterium]